MRARRRTPLLIGLAAERAAPRWPDGNPEHGGRCRPSEAGSRGSSAERSRCSPTAPTGPRASPEAPDDLTAAFATTGQAIAKLANSYHVLSYCSPSRAERHALSDAVGGRTHGLVPGQQGAVVAAQHAQPPRRQGTRSRHGKEPTHCRTGTPSGSTRSTKSSAASVIRRPRRLGKKTRRLQLNAQTSSGPQRRHRQCSGPYSSNSQRKYSRTSDGTKSGRPPASSARSANCSKWQLSCSSERFFR